MSNDNEEVVGSESEPGLNMYAPMQTGPSVPHYYGDYVRQIFMLCAAIMLVVAPFLAGNSSALLPFEIGGAIIIAILGALTNPRNQISMLANAVAAGVGIVIYELLALSLYADGHMISFLVREMLAIAFLFALYFSLKTFRNMVFHMIGKRTSITSYYRKNRGDGD